MKYVNGRRKYAFSSKKYVFLRGIYVYQPLIYILEGFVCPDFQGAAMGARGALSSGGRFWADEPLAAMRVRKFNAI